jgi:diguanylate cyclase (GGDEF)-like protein
MTEDLERTHALLKLGDSESAPEQGPPVLVQLAGPGAVRRFALTRQITRIGRDGEANEIVLSDPWVSRRHTQVVIEAGRARIEDRQSRNGCIVNSTRVTDAPLADGDLLQIGQATFKYLEAGSAEAPFYQEVFRMAFHDPVTGSYSRRYFDEALEREILRAQRHGKSLSVLLIDVDNFKQVNDTLGHKVGDRVLSETATALQGALRGESITARFGGDEFAVLLPESSFAEAAEVAEKLRTAIEELGAGRSEPTAVTISIGLAASEPERRSTADELLTLADEALYRAKRRGRNRVEPRPPRAISDEPDTFES